MLWAGRCPDVGVCDLGVIVNVVHVITKGDVGGAQTHVVALVAAQVAAGHQVTVVAGSDGPAMAMARSCGVTVVVLERFVHSLSLRSDRATVRDLFALFRERRADVVHCHSSKGGLLARIAARRAGVPVVYTAHGFPFQRGAPVAQRVQSYVGELVGGRLGDAVICLTTEEAALARRGRLAPPSRIVVIPNGLPDDAPTRSCPAADGVARLVMVARFAPPKRQRELVDVLAAMTDIEWTVTFVGDGPALADVRTHAAGLLGERVDFLGHRDDAGHLVAEYDIAVLWSGYEGMPIALMEAMRAGLACVASDLPGVRRLFGDHGGVTAPNERALGVILRRFCEDYDAVDAAGASARKRFLAEFTVDAMADAIDDVYDQVVAAPVRGRGPRR
jgi:glycosyltransferase involved in cell wall biosynthesis